MPELPSDCRTVADEPVAVRQIFARIENVRAGCLASKSAVLLLRSVIKSKRRLLVLTGGASCLGLLYSVGARVTTNHALGRAYTFTLPPTKIAAQVKALPPPNLLRALSPEQASTENAERPFVSRADTPARRFILKTDAENRSRAQTCLAQAVYYEAASESIDGGRAVAQVVLNRVQHPGFPSTICGVVYEGADRPTGCQFSFTCNGAMQHVPVAGLWTRSRKIADEALGGHIFKPVGHATHYHADYVLPYWADSLDKSVQVGRHIFYRLRSTLGDATAFSQRYGGTEPLVREPGTKAVIVQTDVTLPLAKALASVGSQTSTEQTINSPLPLASPLLVDSNQRALLVDGGNAPPPSKHMKWYPACPSALDRKKVSPLGADDVRAGIRSDCQ